MQYSCCGSSLFKHFSNYMNYSRCLLLLKLFFSWICKVLKLFRKEFILVSNYSELNNFDFIYSAFCSELLFAITIIIMMLKNIKFSYTNKLLLKSVYRASKDQRFLRFIDFDANYLSQTPFFFRPFEPMIITSKNAILSFHQLTGLPWWLTLSITCFVIRLTIFPLILIQMKRLSKLGPIAPAFVHIKDSWKLSSMSRSEKLSTAIKIYRAISLNEKFRFSTIFVYNLVYYPLLISMILSIRKVLADPAAADATFLHITNFTDIDPYYILPALTVGLYYYNFQRFITPQNRHTLISRIRIACQLFLIAWFPFLCCWPSGIVFYMCFNAALSVIQSSVLQSPWFITKISQKVMIYNMMLSKVEYDKGTSQSIIGAVKSGEEFLKDKAIKEELLVNQTKSMLYKLQQQEVKDKKQQQQLENKLLEQQMKERKGSQKKDDSSNRQ